MTIDIHICSRDRVTEVFGLLTSLLNQSFQNFDIYLLDDASGTNYQSVHFFNSIVTRLRLDGHRVVVLRNEISKGVCKARQQLIDYSLVHGRGEYICRLDDDTILEYEYFDKLMDVVVQGYDIASGISPPLMSAGTGREMKYVMPIINRIVLDEQGRFLVNSDDCGHTYLHSYVLPAHHFRSNALMHRSVCEKVRYDDIISSESGFREETFFSLRAILAGFKIGVHTGAVAWHLITPSGGERRQHFGQHALMNQQLLNRRVKEWYKEHGDFITAYNARCGIVDEPKEIVLMNLRKNNNLLFSTED